MHIDPLINTACRTSTVANPVNAFPTGLADLTDMKPSGSLMLLISMAYLLLFAEAVSQGGPHALCSNYEKTATNGKPCPKIQKPVCGTDGQTYDNLCEFCKAAMERNGKLGFKHNGKC
ncbi:LOW QUALITY PROTEIN: serine protease inhibitor Kazal-type 12-like [Rousettus aegyptiacus]|uniref:LOW QUALITY PROTEIN: serine protease inhibitor Kazal-type 12-like n=1 Tax=Rousettus aegyptiacus TaxID=9407 RepID=UPI00168D1817|nr:LOW QUALITY PROTEIN: serine protease inhibitor Kazal-type 12-like [Rousettus aegyptiacus]